MAAMSRLALTRALMAADPVQDRQWRAPDGAASFFCSAPFFMQ
jgi:hypothetical protein